MAVLLQPPRYLRQRTSLYVGDLDPEVTETDLSAAFFQMGSISSVRLCRCARSGKSLCYGYVNFYSHDQACKALSILNHAYLKGKPMRLMWSQRDPFARKSGIGNLFVKNLDASINSACLETLFCKFGTILSCKVVEENGKSKGFGFVQFDSEDSALAARTSLHDTMVKGKKIYVSKFIKKSERTTARPCEELEFTNLYVKNLAKDMTEDTLKSMFSAFGKVCNVVIMKDHDRKSRGFGFVNFESPEDAKKAVDALNGYPLGSRSLFVGRAQNKTERINVLQHEYKGFISNNIEKSRMSNLFVKNLDVSINERKLHELFSGYGQIVSAKVMRNDSGVSKGFGFVSFSSPEEAETALNSLNGTLFEGKSLFVAIAKCKSNRSLELQKYFPQHQSQMLYLPNCNIFPPPTSPLYYSPCFPSIFPYHPISYPNFGANMGVDYTTAAQNYQQPFCSYFVKRTTSNLRDRDLNLNNGYAGIQNVGTRKKWTKKVGATGSTSKGLQATACLSAARSPSNSKKDLVNLLPSLVQNLQPELAGKMTGMLLEMSKSEIVNLLNSPNSLALQVDRAAQVLKEANAMKAADTGAVLPKCAYYLRY
ncbi:polyadenylate-binding protein 6 isoform X2 [Jatropha curcas]|uniref:polyadenylate-binding protein 6 isoform X2 n=1 Tax=Jatropha curcas TaxID=180498 RepID=UPI0005FB8605|nr:polyadenylate-binding protein 6 isoform X2 [Jatropha curcas]